MCDDDNDDDDDDLGQTGDVKCGLGVHLLVTFQ